MLQCFANQTSMSTLNRKIMKMPTQKREQSCKYTEFPLKRMEGIPPRDICIYEKFEKKGQNSKILYLGLL